LPDEENPKGFTGKPKCGGRNRTKGESPTAVSGAQAAEGGAAYTRCYTQLLSNHDNEHRELTIQDVAKYMKEKLATGQMIHRIKENGDEYTFVGAVAGNKTYAFRRGKDLDEVMERIGFEKENTAFITLTVKYSGDEKEREKSWLDTDRELPKLLRKLRRNGMAEYARVYEANGGGGCHVHILAKWKWKLKIANVNGVERIVSPDINSLCKENWIGHVDVRGMKDDNAAGYMKKYLGKFGHVEGAIERALRNWEKEGDQRYRKTDVKNLWTFYSCATLKKRQFTTSRASPEQKEKAKAAQAEKAAQAAALIKEMNNTTEREKPKWIEEIKIPKWVNKHKDFMPYNCKLEKGGKMWELLNDYRTWINTIYDGKHDARASYYERELEKCRSFYKWRKNKNEII